MTAYRPHTNKKQRARMNWRWLQHEQGHTVLLHVTNSDIERKQRACAALAAVSLWITLESLRPRESPREIGLRGLKEECLLDGAAFDRISAWLFAIATNLAPQITSAGVTGTQKLFWVMKISVICPWLPPRLLLTSKPWPTSVLRPCNEPSPNFPRTCGKCSSLPLGMA